MTDKVIKSVRRVFEILELFDKVGRPLTAKEIGDELGYPLTSAHALMKSMAELGYAEFDQQNWTFIPSHKCATLSEWVNDFLDRETSLIDCMHKLNLETKETVNLSRLTAGTVKIIHGLECIQPVGVSVKVGTIMPATESLTGLTAIASLDDAAFSEYRANLKRIRSGSSSEINFDLIEQTKYELKKHGTVAKSDLWVQGIGAVCIPVLTAFTNEILVIGVVGPSNRMAKFERQHRRTLKLVVQEFGVKQVFKTRG